MIIMFQCERNMNEKRMIGNHMHKYASDDMRYVRTGGSCQEVCIIGLINLKKMY